MGHNNYVSVVKLKKSCTQHVVALFLVITDKDDNVIYFLFVAKYFMRDARTCLRGLPLVNMRRNGCSTAHGHETV